MSRLKTTYLYAADPHDLMRDFNTFKITSEIALRLVVPEDAVSHQATLTDEESMKYFGPGKTYEPQRSLEIVNDWAYRSNNTAFCKVWSILFQEAVAGVIGLEYLDDREAFEVFYFTNPSFRGKGLVPQAFAELSSQLLKANQGQPVTFFATAHPLNAASNAVLRKPNFQLIQEKAWLEKFKAERNIYELKLG